MFMGAVLLLSALVTWAIALMMSPHGETVAHGTEFLRRTILTFKRNAALGTLVLAALSAWLLFPSRRPRWPIRDGILIAVFAFLAGTSIYTLISIERPSRHAANVSDNVASADSNYESNGNMSETAPTTSAIDIPPSAVGSTAATMTSPPPRANAVRVAGLEKQTQADQQLGTSEMANDQQVETSTSVKANNTDSDAQDNQGETDDSSELGNQAWRAR